MRGDTFALVLVPGDMTYHEWLNMQHEKYGKDVVDVATRKAVNRGADEGQYERYVRTLGKKNVPKTFNEFQSMKYSDAHEYGVLKAQYRGMGYYQKAIDAEPSITGFVSGQAKELGFGQEGLEYRIKSQDSFMRKIRVEYDPTGNAYEVKDILRYTYTAQPSDLAGMTLKNIDSMSGKGYNTDRVKNYWLMPMNPYKGINTFVTSPSGQVFELQYHTPESFGVKNGEMHTLYERWRTLKSDDPARADLEREMSSLAESITRPSDIERVR